MMSGLEILLCKVNDILLPVDTAFYPVNIAQSVELNPVLKISFNKNVLYATGKKMYLKNAADNAIIETITESGITGTGTNIIRFKLKNKLTSGMQYYIEIDPGAIVDVSINAFAGLQGNDKWTFSTTVTFTDNLQSKHSVQVFPVPAHEVINFSFENFAKHKVDIFNPDGLKVNSFTTNDMLYAYSCGSMKKGVYVCHILNDRDYLSRKILIE